MCLFVSTLQVGITGNEEREIHC